MFIRIITFHHHKEELDLTYHDGGAVTGRMEREEDHQETSPAPPVLICGPDDDKVTAAGLRDSGSGGTFPLSSNEATLGSGKISDSPVCFPSGSHANEVRNFLEPGTVGCYVRLRGVWHGAVIWRVGQDCDSCHDSCDSITVHLIDRDEIHEIQSCNVRTRLGDIPAEDRVDSGLRLKRMRTWDGMGTWTSSDRIVLDKSVESLSERTVGANSSLENLYSVSSVNIKINFLSQSRTLSRKFEIPGVPGPVGVVVLPESETILVACRSTNQVLKFSRSGHHLGALKGRRGFSRPTNIHLMKSGHILIRDGLGIQKFDGNYEFVQSIGEIQRNKYFGMTETDDHIVTINSNSGPELASGGETGAGNTDLFYFNKYSGELELRVLMEDVTGDKENSSLRNLAYHDGKLYVVDMINSCIYRLAIEDGEEEVARFGDAEVVNKPSCLIVDDFGNTMVTDSGSNRLLLFDADMMYCGDVKVELQIYFRNQLNAFHCPGCWGAQETFCHLLSSGQKRALCEQFCRRHGNLLPAELD